jgi:hypothetical protein
LRRAQERRFELQVMSEASKIRHEQFLVGKLEGQKRQREEALLKESKQVMKKEREAKKLELLEAEVMKRLRDTHLRQQQAIEEIQEIFHKKNISNIQFDPISQQYVQPDIALRGSQDQVVFSHGGSKNGDQGQEQK